MVWTRYPRITSTTIRRSRPWRSRGRGHRRQALNTPTVLPELAARLTGHTRTLLRLWQATPFDPDPARQVGAALVDEDLSHPDTIDRTVALLAGLRPCGR